MIAPLPAAYSRATPSLRLQAAANLADGHGQLGCRSSTIGLARAEAKLMLANLAYNFDRLVFHDRRAVAA